MRDTVPCFTQKKRKESSKGKKVAVFDEVYFHLILFVAINDGLS